MPFAQRGCDPRAQYTHSTASCFFALAAFALLRRGKKYFARLHDALESLLSRRGW